jgi:[ribosomal protein S5]-alanine N-acetyltransferase
VTADAPAVFITDRLIVRAATPDDAAMFHTLWTDPAVMRHVGFPQGLRMTADQIRAQLAGQADSPFEQYLVIELKATGQAIGECKMIRPDSAGIAETDVKLLPAFWGHRYGVEVKRGLLDYLFTHTDCRAVQATPNINNIASIKMQEAVGGVRVGEGVFQVPPAMQGYRTAVPHYIYHVYREIWERLSSSARL